MRKYLVLLPMFAFFWYYRYTHQAGTGGDSDPKTYHFIPTNENRQLATADAIPIKNEDVLLYYQNPNGFDILLDGLAITSYNWDFSPDANGINDARWNDDNFPPLESFRIDTTRGRIKSNPALNWKYAVKNGFNLGADTSKPILMRFEPYRNGATETIVGVVVYTNTSGQHVFRTFELSAGENIDSYDNTSGWNVSAETAFTSQPSASCSEIASDHDSSSANTNAGFVVYCTDKIFVWIYNGAWSTNATSISFSGDGGDTRITRHVDIAINGTAGYVVVFTEQSSSILIIQKYDGSNTTQYSKTFNTCVEYPSSTGNYYYYKDAYDATVDAAAGQYYYGYVQEFASTPTNCTAPSILKPRVFASTQATCSAAGAGTPECVIPIDESNGNLNKNPLMAAVSANKAFITWLSAPETTGIYTLKGAVRDYDSNIPPSGDYVWPMEGSFNTSGVSQGKKVAQISDPGEDVPIIQHDVQVGQGEDIYVFWTQGGPASNYSTLSAKLAEPARFVFFRRWRFGNYNSSDELKLDSISKTSYSTNTLSSLAWTPSVNGQAHFSFVQDGIVHFGISSGLDLPSAFTSFQKGQTVTSTTIVRAKTPQPSGSKPADGRTILFWLEGSTLYSRAYYNAINLQVSYFSKDWGTVLKPDGGKPPLVRNNYIRPGYDKDVEIFINDRSPDETVTVKIYTIDGKLVKVVADNVRYDSFRQPLKWNKRNSSGQLVSSGVYHVYVTTSGGYKASHPIVIVR